jgi:putative nucleotide binding protein
VLPLEDYAHILDYLPQGLPTDRNYKREPLAYAVGSQEFKLFELVPKDGVVINMGDRAYIGKDAEKRDKIIHVKRRIAYSELTAAGQAELPFVLTEIVKMEEERFMRFFNESQPISIRQHMLELLPGLGKKTMMAILEERKKGKFKDFNDLATRVTSLKHPDKVVAKRIELELSNPSEKYHLFVAR